MHRKPKELHSIAGAGPISSALHDAHGVRDAATLEKPHQYAEGYSHVIVNGQAVYENGAITAASPGRVLNGPGKPGPVQ